MTSDTRTMTRTISAAALTITVGLALTACSGAKNVYDFTQINGLEPASEIRIQIPDGLKKAAGSDVENLLVTSYAAKSRDLGAARYCAIDVDITYAGGGVEKLTVPRYTAEQAAADTEKAQKAFLDRFEVASVQELEQQKINEVTEHANAAIGRSSGPQTLEAYLQDRYDTTDIKVAAAHYLLSLSTEAIKVRDQFESGDAKSTASVEKVVTAVNAHIDRENQERVAEAAAVPKWERVSGPLGLGRGKSKNDLDEKAPKKGSYFSEDLKQVTVVEDCAKSSTDSDSASELKFPTSTDKGIRTFAEFELVVMKSGDLSIAKGKVNGFVRDANGDWIAR